MSDAIRRGIRTALWLTLALAPSVPAIAAILDIDAATVAQVTAIFGVIGSVLTALINGLEDNGTIPALLKSKASSGAEPITNDPVL